MSAPQDDFIAWDRWDQDNETSWHAGGLEEIDSFYDLANNLDDVQTQPVATTQNSLLLDSAPHVISSLDQETAGSNAAAPMLDFALIDRNLEAASTLLSIKDAVSLPAAFKDSPVIEEEGTGVYDGERDLQHEAADSAVGVDLKKTPRSPVAPEFEPLSPLLPPVKKPSYEQQTAAILAEGTPNEDEALPPLTQDNPNDPEPDPEPRTPTGPDFARVGLKVGLVPSSSPDSGRFLLKREMRSEDIRVGHYQKTIVSPFPLTTPRRKTAAEPFNDAENPSIIPIRPINLADNARSTSMSSATSPAPSATIMPEKAQQTPGLATATSPAKPPPKRRRGRPARKLVVAGPDEPASSPDVLAGPPTKKQKTTPGPIRPRETRSKTTKAARQKTMPGLRKVVAAQNSAVPEFSAQKEVVDGMIGPSLGQTKVEDDLPKPSTSLSLPTATQEENVSFPTRDEKAPKDTFQAAGEPHVSEENDTHSQITGTPPPDPTDTLKKEIEVVAEKQATDTITAYEEQSNMKEVSNSDESERAPIAEKIEDGQLKDTKLSVDFVQKSTPTQDPPAEQSLSPSTVPAAAEKPSKASSDKGPPLSEAEVEVQTPDAEFDTSVLSPTDAHLKLFDVKHSNEHETSSLSSLDSTSTLTDLESDREQNSPRASTSKKGMKKEPDSTAPKGAAKTTTKSSTKSKAASKAKTKTAANPPNASAKATATPKTAAKRANEVAASHLEKSNVGARELSGMLGLLNDEGLKQQMYSMGGSPRATRNTRNKTKEAAAEQPIAAAAIKRRHSGADDLNENQKAKKAKTKK